MIERKISWINLAGIRKYIGLLCIILVAMGTSSAVSNNIVINPGFEAGTAPWVFYTNGAGNFLNDASGSGSTHAGHITISQPGTNVQLYQAGLVLEPNALYQLNFKTYSNTGHDLTVSLQKHGSPYNSYGLSNYVVNVGTAFSEYSIQFTTSGFSGNVNDARLMFWLAPYDAASDQFYFDDVSLTKVSSVTPPPPSTSSIVSNAGFESGTTPWVFYTNGAGNFLNDAPGSGSIHAGHITISQPGTNVQLYQAGLVLEPNTVYKLSYKAYSNSGHDLSVSLQKHGSPYTNYGLSNYGANLGTSWSDYSIQFTTSGFSGTVNDARLMFWLAPHGVAGDQYFIDDVILSKASGTTVPPPPITSQPTITAQPTGQAVRVGQIAAFTVVATGTAPLSYKWQKNGVTISGATGASYITPATTLSDNGAIFRVIVSNAAGSVTSNNAVLTVTSAPPTPSNKQLILLDTTYTHSTAVNNDPWWGSGKAFSFFNLPSWIPTNFVSPTNYAQGTLYQRLVVLTKPSSKPVFYQICLFQDSVVPEKHACSGGPTFTTVGTYYYNEPMTSLYQYNKEDWSRSLLVEMLVVKDGNGVPVDDRYGWDGQWNGSPNFNLFYPMKVRYTAIIVPSGGGAPVWP